ncbi:MAG: macro domain-containing protein, partial [Candidatus Omnitrophica bacterium]|nr:macro domain-containing protein [Candidatus Omnitrophota bacterium]MDD5353442.1 macro domain-containing protein [Candidatus Omnitrophota bacterium]MDD5551447.1 macro domain-containing protein [Candidatus Omnitrophota bacterium]
HVIHTVGPVWRDGKHNEPELLASCYRNSLNLAKEHGLKTIAFPSISTGVYRFPIELAAPIAIKTVKDFITQNPGALEKVIFVLFSAQDLRVYDSI